MSSLSRLGASAVSAAGIWYSRSMKNKGILIFWLIIGALIVAGFGGSVYMKYKPNELVGFTQCLADSGAKFYGAFWCPHCQAQKKMFGSSEKYLPYIECSTPDGQKQLDICKDAGINGYPTWEFADGSRVSGEQSLAILSEKTGCVLPGGAASAPVSEEGAASAAE